MFIQKHKNFNIKHKGFFKFLVIFSFIVLLFFVPFALFLNNKTNRKATNFYIQILLKVVSSEEKAKTLFAALKVDAEVLEKFKKMVNNRLTFLSKNNPLVVSKLGVEKIKKNLINVPGATYELLSSGAKEQLISLVRSRVDFNDLKKSKKRNFLIRL